MGDVENWCVEQLRACIRCDYNPASARRVPAGRADRSATSRRRSLRRTLGWIVERVAPSRRAAPGGSCELRGDSGDFGL